MHRRLAKAVDPLKEAARFAKAGSTHCGLPHKRPQLAFGVVIRACAKAPVVDAPPTHHEAAAYLDTCAHALGVTHARSFITPFKPRALRGVVWYAKNATLAAYKMKALRDARLGAGVQHGIDTAPHPSHRGVPRILITLGVVISRLSAAQTTHALHIRISAKPRRQLINNHALRHQVHTLSTSIEGVQRVKVHAISCLWPRDF